MWTLLVVVLLLLQLASHHQVRAYTTALAGFLPQRALSLASQRSDHAARDECASAFAGGRTFGIIHQHQHQHHRQRRRKSTALSFCFIDQQERNAAPGRVTTLHPTTHRPWRRRLPPPPQRTTYYNSNEPRHCYCRLWSSKPRLRRHSGATTGTDTADDNDDENEDSDPVAQNIEEEELSLGPAVHLPGDWDDDGGGAGPLLDPEMLLQLTVPELKQQLRLRNLPVSGRKDDLRERLKRAATGRTTATMEVPAFDAASKTPTPSTTTAASSNHRSTTDPIPEPVDVSEYLDDDEQGNAVRTARIGSRGAFSSSSSAAATTFEVDSDNDPSNESGNSDEVWGRDARIVDDYEGRQVVVDGLARTVVEYIGSNQTVVRAYCVASRDALKPFLAGLGTTSRHRNNSTSTSTTTTTYAEQRLRELQSQRERASRRPVHGDDDAGIDEGDENGLYRDVLHRDVSDWGKYTPTGAQLSAAEVRGVLLLSDVKGPFDADARTLADKIAFECQPAVVLAPDVFRGVPWTGDLDATANSVNDLGQSYEKWRALHPDRRVHIDVRAAAACLRERYGCSAVALWGTCYGGGRALEAAAGWLPDGGNVHDVDGSVGPPLVEPAAVVAWYPTRYRAADLFGGASLAKRHRPTEAPPPLAVMAVFAGLDDTPGATAGDAAELKRLLELDPRVKDHLVKVFPGQPHGFAHRGLSHAAESATDEDPYDRFVDEEFGGAGRVSVGVGSDAEVASLLSTAFMETYSRVFLPTVGPPISLDEQEGDWSQRLEMRDLSEASTRDIRREIQESLDSFVEEPLLGGNQIDPTDPSQEDALKNLLRSMQDPSVDGGENAIGPEDDLPTIYAKLLAQDDQFQIF